MRQTYVKRATPGTPADFYAAEAAGLAWLAAAGPGAARTVGVLEVSADRIVLRKLQTVRPDQAAAAEFGQALARTHAAGAAAFGSPPDGLVTATYIGRQPMQSEPRSEWGLFYAEQRVLPFARAAARIGHLSPDGLELVERVARRLTAGEFDDDRPPARIHGDLWAGNLVHTADGVVLIDPAAHGGHGLTDLAMLHLFGAPGLDVLTAAYAEAAALPTGWQRLLGLHQLHPLLVHAVSHGASYGTEAERVAGSYA